MIRALEDKGLNWNDANRKIWKHFITSTPNLVVEERHN